MNKRLRIEYAGAVYHVIQRGNNKEFVFHQAQDKGYFLKSVEKVMRFCEADTFAYVIMGNHYHLLVRTGEIGLGQVMHRLNTRYSMYYNQTKNRSGHVFQGRYQAGLIQDERHLLTVLRYIHQNPLRAGICDRVGEYRWSSDHCYRYLQPGFVNKEFVLDLLASDQGKARNEYLHLMESVVEPENDYDDNFEKIPWIPDIKPAAPILSTSAAKQLKSLDEILLAATIKRETFELIKAGSRRRELTPLKAIFIDLALQEGHPLQNIAAHINISVVAAFKLKNVQNIP
ncbi:MAG TPA: transposase [Syntrophomonas sp.]|nr:transposase [Syntrophomonas sp.]HRW11874.1 transposase [Syntrophomonas sp.]